MTQTADVVYVALDFASTKNVLPQLLADRRERLLKIVAPGVQQTSPEEMAVRDLQSTGVPRNTSWHR